MNDRILGIAAVVVGVLVLVVSIFGGRLGIGPAHFGTKHMLVAVLGVLFVGAGVVLAAKR